MPDIHRDRRGDIQSKLSSSAKQFKMVTSLHPQVAFKTFLNISPSVSFPPPSANANSGLPQPSEFVLSFDENPLAEFAELPRDAQEGGLWFSNVLCGVIRGALEMVSPGTGVDRLEDGLRVLTIKSI